MSAPATPPTASGDHCESCRRIAQVALTFPDTTFKLCVRCVPAELLPTAAVLPGGDGVDLLVELILEQHRQPTLPAAAP